MRTYQFSLPWRSGLSGCTFSRSHTRIRAISAFRGRVTAVVCWGRDGRGGRRIGMMARERRERKVVSFMLWYEWMKLSWWGNGDDCEAEVIERVNIRMGECWVLW
jgi:hypothetical protein